MNMFCCCFQHFQRRVFCEFFLDNSSSLFVALWLDYFWWLNCDGFLLVISLELMLLTPRFVFGILLWNLPLSRTGWRAELVLLIIKLVCAEPPVTVSERLPLLTDFYLLFKTGKTRSGCYIWLYNTTKWKELPLTAFRMTGSTGRLITGGH